MNGTSSGFMMADVQTPGPHMEYLLRPDRDGRGAVHQPRDLLGGLRSTDGGNRCYPAMTSWEDWKATLLQVVTAHGMSAINLDDYRDCYDKGYYLEDAWAEDCNHGD
jgi:hypothetical protein